MQLLCEKELMGLEKWLRSSRGREFGSQHPHQKGHNCLSAALGPGAQKPSTSLSSSSGHLHTCDTHTYTELETTKKKAGL